MSQGLVKQHTESSELTFSWKMTAHKASHIFQLKMAVILYTTLILTYYLICFEQVGWTDILWLEMSFLFQRQIHRVFNSVQQQKQSTETKQLKWFLNDQRTHNLIKVKTN